MSYRPRRNPRPTRDQTATISIYGLRVRVTRMQHCREIGFDSLAPIIWSKIANAVYEVERGAGGFLGKPYEPNAIQRP